MKRLAAGVRAALGLGLAVALLTLVGALPATAAAPTELFFSEYIEGTSNNKALEIYNGTGASVDLGTGGYNVQMFFNGSATAGLTINLVGTVANGDVFVLAQSSAAAAILAQADQTNGAGWFNGDDAVVLRKGTVIIDAIGQIGFDPGTEWGTGLTSTADNTLRRKSAIIAGDTNGTDVFDPAIEWDGFATDTFDGLGSHTITTEVTLSIGDVMQSEGNAGTTTFSFTVSLSSPAPAGGVTFDIATANGSAIEPGDYTAKSLTGQTISATNSAYTFDVLVNGDTTSEPDEAFFVNVTNVTGATVADGQGQGTIVNDDVCDLPYTPIYQIQGSGSSAAITGSVTTEGIVVGDFEGPIASGIQGFYIQDPTGDGDAATSDGIFVFTGNANNGVSAGQLVRVTGFARERFNQTTINGANTDSSAVPASGIVPCGTGSVTPVAVTLPFATADFPERYEGMSVRLPQALVISEYFNYDRFGEIVLAQPLPGEARAFTPTSIEEPGSPGYTARLNANLLSRITLDDGLGIQNPEFLRHPNGMAFSTSNRFRGGDTVANTVGVLGFDFSLYRIQPTGPATYTAVNPRPGGPSPVGGSLRVAAMNTLNFFLTLDYPTGNPLDNTCGPAQSVECRGADADQPDEFTRQRDKLLQALNGIDADVLGLNELENTTGVDPLSDPNGIVPGLNAIAGAGTYAAITTGVIGTDAIRVGLIYKPAKVTPVGPFKLLTSAVDPRFIDTKSRPVLAQTFQVNATGARFTVAVNHLKSKGSDCLDVGDPDTGDGQGNCNLTRKAAAEALVDWLGTDPTGSGDPDFLIVGDLNSYAMEDPIDAIKAGPDDTLGTADDYVNLVAEHLGPYAYSYVFDGQAGYLDHALANENLAAQVSGVTEWHINADEPDVVDYDTSFKGPNQEATYEPNAFRSSDHDPIIVGLDLEVQCNGVEATITGSGTIVGTPGDDVIVGSAGIDNIVGGNGRDLICGGLGDDTIDGGNAADVIFGDGGASFGNMAATGGNDTISGGNGNDEIYGEAGNDTIDAGGGDDFATGNAGQDVVLGGSGDDTLFGGTQNDTVDGGSGSDFVFGTFGDDTLLGGSGDDFLDGDLPPDQDVGAGPGVDPNPNTDSCNGGSGHDQAFGCEVRTAIEVVIPSF
jgi:predicted extracellular nuclease